MSHTLNGRFGEITDADKIMHPQRFGTESTDPTDIRIRINPKIRFESHLSFYIQDNRRTRKRTDGTTERSHNLRLVGVGSNEAEKTHIDYN